MFTTRQVLFFQKADENRNTDKVCQVDFADKNDKLIQQIIQANFAGKRNHSDFAEGMNNTDFAEKKITQNFTGFFLRESAPLSAKSA